MAQFARPSSDVAFSMLGGTPTNTAGNRYQNIDETSPVDTEYNYTQNNPGGTSSAEFGLSSVTDPSVSTGHVLRFRCMQIDEDSGSHPRPADTTGTATTMPWELRQGATIITSGTASPGNAATTTVNLTGTEADSITNYGDLRFFINPGGGGGSPANRRAVALIWVELEVPDAIVSINPSGIASGEAIGSHSLLPGGIAVIPAGIGSAEALGALTLKPLNIIVPTGITSDEIVPSPIVVAIATISPAAISSGEVVPNPSLLPGGVQVVPAAIDSAEAFGVPTLTSIAWIIPAGIASGEVVGTPLLFMPEGPWIIGLTGIPSAEAFGSPTVLPGAVLMVPTGIDSGEVLGSPVILPGAVVIAPQGVSTGEVVPDPTIIPGGVTIVPVGISSGESLGAAILAGLSKILPAGIPSSELLGAAELLPGPVVIAPTGISSEELLGNPELLRSLTGNWKWLSRIDSWPTLQEQGFRKFQDVMAQTKEDLES